MDQTNQPAKSVWRSPEIIDVGGVLETTTSGPENVRDNLHTDPPAYNLSRMSSDEEVQL